MNKTSIVHASHLTSASQQAAAMLALPSRKKGTPRLLIGRKEWISLPKLGISWVNTKTDSGALSSCLHAETLTLSDDAKEVSFITRDHQQNPISCTSPIIRYARVRSSSGHGSPRIFIRTTAQLAGGFEWEILLSLADRSEMRCPMLLGRRAMAGVFMIDPQSAYLLGNLQTLR